MPDQFLRLMKTEISFWNSRMETRQHWSGRQRDFSASYDPKQNSQKNGKIFENST